MPNQNKITLFSDFCEEFIEGHAQYTSSTAYVASQRSIIKHLVEAMGHQRLCDIDSRAVARFQFKRRQAIIPKTIFLRPEELDRLVAAADPRIRTMYSPGREAQ